MQKSDFTSQINLLFRCNNATELLTAKETITTTGIMSDCAVIAYDFLMLHFLKYNLIA